MNVLRIVLNLLLAAACAWGGIRLLTEDAFFLRDRWNPPAGTLFSGLSLDLLALGFLLLAGFVAAVTLAWVKGTQPMPEPGTVRPHPVYRGQLILRYWYFVLPAAAFILGAFVLATHVPNPSLATP